MKRLKLLATLNLVVLLLHISLSYATQMKLINTKDVGEVSDQYHSLFVPAGITFAIWGLIYFSLLVFCIRNVIVSFDNKAHYQAKEDISRIGPWFIINNLLTMAWLYAWVNEQLVISLYLIVGQLLCLMIIHVRLHIHSTSRSFATRAFTFFPLSIYFGWISVATIANSSIFLSTTSWDRWGIGEEQWTIIMIIASVLIAALVIIARKNVFYGLVFIWALFGLLYRWPLNGDHPSLSLVAAFGMAALAIICLFQFVRNIRTRARHLPFPESHSPIK